MNSRIAVGIPVGLCLLFLTGCSGGGSNPILPAAGSDPDLALTAGPDDRTHDVQQSTPLLIGYYDVLLDLENQEFELVPNRSIDFALNLMFFLNTPTGLSFNLNDIISVPDFVDIDIDITLNHPFDDAMFNIYDVRAVFMGDGSWTMNYDSDLIYSDPATDPTLLNADGFTRWYNPSEFIGDSLFHYAPNLISTPDYTCSATLNPYKYYGSGLGAGDNVWNYLTTGGPAVGYFTHGMEFTRNFLIRFPNQPTGIKYGFAIIANWEGTTPEFHPSHANEAVGISLEDYSTLYFVGGTDSGGNLVLDISVFDWDAELTGGVMLDYDIYLDSTVLLTDYKLNTSEMSATASGPNWNTFHVEIPADTITSTVGNELWVIIEDGYADYTNPFGVLNKADDDPIAACFRYDLIVSGEPPDPWIIITDPNGGEHWAIGFNGEITWDSLETIENVKIELSMNSGASYDYVLAATTPNDGIFEWNSIPMDFIGTQNRIKMSDVTNPLVSDESDADFTISGDWIKVTNPNGGEVWTAFTDHEITWLSSGLTGTVNIDFSTDDFISEIHIIAVNAPNTGSYLWEFIPAEISDTVKVRIINADPLVSDRSDQNFSIMDPGYYIDLLTPDGGEEWKSVSENDITWFSYGNFDSIDIYYSPDNFISIISTVATDLSDTGNYTWETKLLPTDTGRIKIEASVVTTVITEDISAGDFTVLESGWAVNWDKEMWDWYEGIVVDDSGNVLVCGSTDNENESWPVVHKYDTAGNLVWSREFAKSSWDYNYTNSIALDADKNIYIIGDFQGTDIDFDPGPGIFNLSAAINGGFLCKWNPAGEFIWAVNWPGTDRNGCAVIVIGTSTVWVNGYFRGTCDFDPGAGIDNHTSLGGNDSYISAFNMSGVHLWTGTWGHSSSDASGEMGLGPSGNCYVATNVYGTDMDLDPSPGNTFLLSSNGFSDAAVSYFDSTFNFLGAVSWGSSNYDSAYGLDVDPFGNVYVAGYFRNADIDFDPGPGEDLHSTNGLSDTYVTKFNSILEHLWTKTWGGPGGEDAYTLTVNTSGNVAVLGYFNSLTVDFDPGPGEDIKSVGSYYWPGYYSILDTNGNYIRSQVYDGYTEPYDSYFSPSGILYLCGYFEGSVDFSPTMAQCNEDPFFLTTGYVGDGFVAKYMPDGCW